MMELPEFLRRNRKTVIKDNSEPLLLAPVYNSSEAANTASGLQQNEVHRSVVTSRRIVIGIPVPAPEPVIEPEPDHDPLSGIATGVDEIIADVRELGKTDDS